MRTAACALAVLCAWSLSLAAHHSYASYDTARTVTVEGVLEEFVWVAPHSLIKLRGDDGRLYTAEWRAPGALGRIGVKKDTLKPGDRLALKGNPRRDFADTGIMSFKAIRRELDGWVFPPPVSLP